ncbi:MAG: acetyltransferase [Gemmatimonadetes bacterium]|nr:acetyltransferase [Gemmatimonadota bacterium]
MTMPLHLVVPDPARLSAYMDALRRGWSPDNTRPEAAAEELLQIESDADSFLAGQDDREGRGPPITLPDGSEVPRLPGYHRWMWDGEFCGGIGFRWQPGTTALPPHCLGHIGYSVVPWKRRRGYATRALALMLEEVAAEGLPFVELATTLDNTASQRVIEANGGRLVERFRKLEAHGGAEGLRFRITLPR